MRISHGLHPTWAVLAQKEKQRNTSQKPDDCCLISYREKTLLSKSISCHALAEFFRKRKKQSDAPGPEELDNRKSGSGFNVHKIGSYIRELRHKPSMATHNNDYADVSTSVQSDGRYADVQLPTKTPGSKSRPYSIQRIADYVKSKRKSSSPREENVPRVDVRKERPVIVHPFETMQTEQLGSQSETSSLDDRLTDSQGTPLYSMPIKKRKPEVKKKPAKSGIDLDRLKNGEVAMRENELYQSTDEDLHSAGYRGAKSSPTSQKSVTFAMDDESPRSDDDVACTSVQENPYEDTAPYIPLSPSLQSLRRHEYQNLPDLKSTPM